MKLLAAVLTVYMFIVVPLGSDEATLVEQRSRTFCGGHVIPVVATGYSNDEISINVPKWRDGKTATLTTARWGVIAVDPRVIPLGSVVWIPHFKQIFFAEDVGSRIKGHRIDIFFPTREQAVQWGRRLLWIEVCNPRVWPVNSIQREK